MSSPIWQFIRQHKGSEPVPDFDTSTLQTVVSNLRDVQLQALRLGQRNGRDGMAMDLCQKLHKEICKLKAWESGLRIASGELQAVHRQGRFKFDAKKLFVCLRHVATSCNFKVRAVESLLSTVKSFVESAVPKYLSKTITEQLDDMPVPKKSTLHVYELALDVAFIRVLREKSEDEGDVVRYYLSDASPVANQDWLWSQYAELRLSELLDVYDAVCALQRSPSLEDNDVSQEHKEEMQRFHDIIKRGVFAVVNTPVALAIGCRSLVHKALGTTVQ